MESGGPSSGSIGSLDHKKPAIRQLEEACL